MPGGPVLDSSFDDDIARVLEDFVEVGGLASKVIVRRDTPSAVISNIVAALVANQLGIGLAYARQRYVPDEIPFRSSDLFETYRAIYFAGKKHMDQTRERFGKGPKPTVGEVASEAALVRLSTTYFAAGLLFRTGQLFEAHALLRVFLEQVAWAFAVSSMSSDEDAMRVRPSSAIAALKDVVPYVGRLYGLLSRRTHISLDSHGRFVDTSGDEVAVVLRDNARALEESWLLLLAADAWSVVFERSQARFMDHLENWARGETGLTLRSERPFVITRQELYNRLVDAQSAAK